MSELDLTLKELKEHADAINALVNDLYDLFSSKPTDKEEKKEEKKPLTLEAYLLLKVEMVIPLKLKPY